VSPERSGHPVVIGGAVALLAAALAIARRTVGLEER
jgi:MYXO-CTERM domain-containing protein